MALISIDSVVIKYRYECKICITIHNAIQECVCSQNVFLGEQPKIMPTKLYDSHSTIHMNESVATHRKVPLLTPEFSENPSAVKWPRQFLCH